MHHATRTVRVGFALATIAVSVAMPAGCELPGLLIARGLAESRIAATPCAGAPCDREQWAVISAFQDYVGLVGPTNETDFGYRLAVVPPGRQLRFDEGVVAASVNPQMGMRLALVLHDGALLLADFGNPQADVQVDMGAVGVAWSNAGDRLALVTRADPSSTDYQLGILTPELSPLASFRIELPAPPDGALRWIFTVSWSADDERVAVSTNRRVAGTLPRGTIPSRTVILRLADGSLQTHEFSSMFFVGNDTLVAPGVAFDNDLSALAPGEVMVVLQLTENGLEERGRIAGPQSIMASHPASGVFVTIEPSFVGSLPTFPLGLRTTESGPDLVSGFLLTDPNEAIILVPLDLARPVLDALAAEGGMP